MAKIGKNEDGTWNHVALQTEHRVLVNSGSIAPTRMLATRYGVSVTVIRSALAGNADVSTNDDAIPSIHDPFRRGKT